MTLPFKIDDDLERDPTTTAKKCLQDFLQKSGVVQNIADLTKVIKPIQLHLGDAIYPVCSGGWCRSQALWALLRPYAERIILFPPHAARLGWDPYNGRINREKNYAQEMVPDEFSSYFGLEKTVRFGFEHNATWKLIETLPTKENLNIISQFYDQNYFGPNSAWQGKQGTKRIYITFSRNAHIILYRLHKTNSDLKNVVVIAIDSEDLITYPPTFLHTKPRSVKAYEYFASLLTRIFDVN